MRIYFDNCCLNRPFDDLTDNTVRMECEAILSIIDICGNDDWSYFSSDVLLDEILETADHDRREKLLLLYHSATEHISFSEAIFSRANELERFNIKSYDALHVASAEAAQADVFLTTDHRLINNAKKAGIRIPVLNPLIWLVEVLYDRKS